MCVLNSAIDDWRKQALKTPQPGQRIMKIARLQEVEARRASLGYRVQRTSSREVAKLQRVQPACARFLLGGACDKVPTINNGCTEAQ